MFVKQLSVFLENRTQSLNEALKILDDNKIDVSALSLADAADYGMLRMLLSDPEKGKELLKAAGFSAMVTDIICLKISHEPGALCQALNYFANEDIGIEYVYAFADGNQAFAVIKFSDPKKALTIIQNNNLELRK